MNEKNTNQVISIVGPTSTGKSSLAHKLAFKLNTEIISADSRLVYKNLNIGTAKPSKQELAEVKYHLIDTIEPSEKEFSLGDYLDSAKPVIQDLLEKNKIPIVVGGTGFYLRGLLEGLELTDVPPNEEFRKNLQNIETTDLYKQLEIKTQNRIHPNDRYRVIRALEIQLAPQTNEEGLKHIECFHSGYETIWIGLNYKNRDNLREKIKLRTIQMIDTGLIQETEELLEKYGKLDLFKKTIGYKECIDYLEKPPSHLNGEQEKEELIEKIWISTCQYAKRQMTWFRANKNIQWFDPVEDILELDNFLKINLF